MSRGALFGCLAVTMACRGASPAPVSRGEDAPEDTDVGPDPVAPDIDRDDDGSVRPLDCDDHDPGVYPGSSAEVCGDGIAHDCGVGPPCRYAGEWSLANARTITGTVEGEGSGELIVGGGDLNGDGLSDFVSMALADRSLSVVYGPADIATFAEAPATIPDTRSQWLAPVAAGDLDGDGNDDLLVSTETGSYLLAGPLAGTVIASEAATAWITHARLSSATAAGDWNADGIADLAYSWSEEEPHTSFGVFLGPLAGEIAIEQAAFTVRSVEAGHQAGVLSGAGDVDGDGLEDVLSVHDGAALNGYYTGAVSVFYAGRIGEVSIGDADASLRGVNPHERAGWSYDAAGDVNADGYADILVGSMGQHTDWGYAYDQTAIASLVYGPVYGVLDLDHADARYECDADPGHCFGDVRGAGDMDGDGFDDFVVSNPGGWSAPGSQGGAWLFYGPAEGHHSLAVADAALVGQFPTTGYGIDGVGDLDGDGLDDLVIGCPGWRSTPEMEIWPMGGAYVVFGGDL